MEGYEGQPKVRWGNEDCALGIIKDLLLLVAVSPSGEGLWYYGGNGIYNTFDQ